MRGLNATFAGLIAMAAPVAWAAALATPVTVLVEDAASPWSDHKGLGLANDLVRAAFDAAGAPATLNVVPYARCKALVVSGAAPSCFSMSASPEFKNSVRFADKPLFSVTAHFYAATAPARAARSLDEVRRGTRVGIVNGYEYHPAVLALARRGVIFEIGRSEVINLRKLAAGRIDLAIIMTDPLRSETLVERQANVANVRHAFTGPSMGSYIGFSSHNAEGERQRQLFNSGFKTIGENGKRAMLEARWKLQCASFCPE
jgi:polar amino acid transport system substrate-binding protein